MFGSIFFVDGWGGLAKIIGEWYEPERNGAIMGIISINFQLGGSIAALFAGLLLQFGVGWRGPFLYGLPSSLRSSRFGLFLHPAKARKKVIPHIKFGRNAGRRKAELDLSKNGLKHSGWQIVKSLLNVANFRKLLVFSFLIHILRSFFMYWIPKFMVDMGMGQVSAAMTSAVFPLAGCLGTVALGWYTDHYSPPGGSRNRHVEDALGFGCRHRDHRPAHLISNDLFSGDRGLTGHCRLLHLWPVLDVCRSTHS